MLKNNKINIILLGHKALSGKDTFYTFAKEMGYTRVAFADKLKEVAKDLYQLTDDQLFGGSKDTEDCRYPNIIDSIGTPGYKKFLSPRRVMQMVGQHMRSLYPDVWASYVFNVKIPEVMRYSNNIIITDFRFRNEAEVAKSWKHTKNPEANLYFVKLNRSVTIGQSEDISEHDLDGYKNWNYVIDNNGSIIEFKDKVKALLKHIG